MIKKISQEQNFSNKEIRSFWEIFHGKLGFFDSGIWGLEVMKEFQKLYPSFDVIYFGDRANCPYGGRTGAEIQILVESGVDWLAKQGCVIIILACNTAVAHTIRYLQNEKYPLNSGIKILGVTVPGAERVVELWYKKVGVLATVATVREGMYKERVHILSQDTIVQEISAPGLVDLIEQPQINDILLQETLMRVLSQFDPDIEALILGCTHYPIISREISRVWYTLFQRDIILIDPGAEAAKRFMDYLTRHTEMSLSQWSTTIVSFS